MSRYVVVVDMVIRPGEEEALLGKFSGPFTAAIKAQEGFEAVELLQPTDGLSYLLIITFVDQSLQQTWVTSDLHSEVWSAMEAHFASCTVRTFHSA